MALLDDNLRIQIISNSKKKIAHTKRIAQFVSFLTK